MPAGRAARLSVPTLVMYGTASYPFTAENARSLQRAIPQAGLRALKGQGHDVSPATGQARRAVGVGRGRVKQPKRGGPLLIGAIRAGGWKGPHPGPPPLEKGQPGADGGWDRDTRRAFQGAARFEGQPGLQGPDRAQVRCAIARPAAHDRAHFVGTR